MIITSPCFYRGFCYFYLMAVIGESIVYAPAWQTNPADATNKVVQAGIITRVNPSGTINVIVFPDAGGFRIRRDVLHGALYEAGKDFWFYPSEWATYTIAPV
jgi:hypothetical protein